MRIACAQHPVLACYSSVSGVRRAADAPGLLYESNNAALLYESNTHTQSSSPVREHDGRGLSILNMLPMLNQKLILGAGAQMWTMCFMLQSRES